MSGMKVQIREFIVETFFLGEGEDLAPDTSFLKNGIIDSTGMLELVTYLEAHFEIKISDDELVPENLDSLSNIEGFLSRKLEEPIAKAI